VASGEGREKKKKAKRRDPEDAVKKNQIPRCTRLDEFLVVADSE